MNDLVTIITPSYNTADFIADTIRSVQAQTYTNWEMIIVDDHSTDHSEEVITSFLNDGRIRYLKTETNSGAAVCRNYALREARGKWVAFLDSDDLWYPEKLEKQIAFMEASGYDFSYTAYEEIDQDSNPRHVTVTGPKTVNKRRMYNYCWPGCLTVMYNAEKLGLLQIEPIRKNNDYAMWLKLSCKADCHFLPEVLAKYRHGRVGAVSNHGIGVLIKWHYRLFRICEKKDPLSALVLTVRNLIFGTIKKIKYVKR